MASTNIPGTEMVCRVMVEGPKQKLVNQLADSIAQVVKSEIGNK